MTLDVLWWFVSHKLLHNLMVRRLIVTEGLPFIIHINIPLYYIGGKVSLALDSSLAKSSVSDIIGHRSVVWLVVEFNIFLSTKN